MDVDTLYVAMGGSLSRLAYAGLVDGMNEAMIAAQCTTVNEAAMWCAQIGHESVGLLYMEEIADGSAYENRPDLGNTHRGDGRRYKGRGPIQLTGLVNYRAFGGWAASRGFVANPETFVEHSDMVSQSKWGFLAASYYWTVARPDLNAVSNRGDVVTATRRINGGLNGLNDRINRWNRCIPLGVRLLPTGSTQGDDDLKDDERAMLTGIFHQMSGSPEIGKWPGWPTWDKGTGETLTLLDFLRRNNVQVAELAAKLAELTVTFAELSARVEAAGRRDPL